MSRKRFDIEPVDVARFLRALRAEGKITTAEMTRAGRRYARDGYLVIRAYGTEFTVSAEAIDCDCGKGILCPAIEQKAIVR